MYTIKDDKIKAWRNRWRNRDYTYEQCKNWANHKKVKSGQEWFTRFDSGMMPFGFPKHPEIVFMKTGWITWDNFLNKPPLVSYKECHKWALKSGFTKCKDWPVAHKNKQLPAGFPSVPNVTYKHGGWIGWEDFLGIRLQTKIKVNYEQCKRWALKHNITNYRIWYQLVRQGKLPLGYPKSPDQSYKYKGWISWPSFCNRRKLASATYKECLKWARANSIKKGCEWTRAYLPPGFPLNLPKTFKETWPGWGPFLGVRSKFDNVLSYTKCRQWAIKNHIKTCSHWQKLAQTGKLPLFVPIDPPGRYKNSGWNGWPAFLHKNFITRKPTFVECKRWARNHGYRKMSDWIDAYRQKKLPYGFPYEPGKYSASSWAGWAEFLGVKPRKVIANYNECKQWARNHGYRKVSDWTNAYQNGKLPPGFPNRCHVYKEYINWAEFIGIRSREVTATYEECKQWALDHGYKMQRHWIDAYRNGVLPPGYPISPNVKYKKEWINWAIFLNKRSHIIS